MTCDIRTMSHAEVELALDWAAAEGWNPGLGDATPFQVADPDGFVVATAEGAPAAMVSVVRYGADFGFLGFYIAAPARRGRGFGLRVWNAGLARLAGRTVGLDGVVAQQDNYRRSGFAYAWPNFRFGGRVAAAPDAGLVDARSLPFDALEALDRELFPAPRPAFLAAWLAMPASRSLGLVEDG
ncbi:MAG: GNAT family N-acetyltransferase, partial [Geminicoccaceae bacterium]